MRFPDEIRDAVAAAVREYPGDIDRSSEVALATIQGLAVYEEIIPDLVAYAVQKMVYEARCSVMERLKRPIQEPAPHETNGHHETNGRRRCPEQKVRSTSPLLESIERESYLDYYLIGGRSIGDVLGADLADLESKERAIANGHLTKAEVVSWLRGIVPADRRVRDVVAERRLRAKVLQLEQGLPTAMAGH